MTINKAIKVLTDILNYVKPGDPPEEHQAIKMGINALTRIRAERKHQGGLYNFQLDGETKR